MITPVPMHPQSSEEFMVMLKAVGCYATSSALQSVGRSLRRSAALAGVLARRLALTAVLLTVATTAARAADDTPATPDRAKPAEAAKPAASAVLLAPAAVLSVPSCAEWMHLAVASGDQGQGAVPQPIGGEVRLVEIGGPGQTIFGRWTMTAAADGTLCDRKVLMVSVPPAPPGAPARKFRLEASGDAPLEVKIGETKPGKGQSAVAGFQWRAIDKASLGLWENNRQVLTYNFETILNAKVPAKDPRRTRSGFVHPIFGLHGELLTDSFPNDHYHHHGLFWSWPHVGIDGKQYDLWVDEGIEQRFVRFLGREASGAGAVLGVEAGWFVGSKKVMIERAWLRIWPANGKERSIDLQLVLIPVGRPVTLQGAEGKSYGGVNLRYAPRKNTAITVPKGRTTEDLPDAPLAWADLSAQFRGAPTRSGAAIFVPTTHADYPPTWLTRHYGILCVGWPGVRARTFPADKPIAMDYRVWIHKQDASVEEISRAYTGYTLGAKAGWE
jgi:hypothetical protein